MEADILEWFNGCIFKEDERDWKLWGSGIEIPVHEPKLTYEYNQLEFKSKYGANLCTLYAPMSMACDLDCRLLSDDERNALAKIRFDMEDFNPGYGWYLVEWVNCVRRFWNDRFETKLAQYSVEKWSSEFYDALDKWHRINIWYKWNNKYNLDAADGVLDDLEVWTTTYGHSTTVKRIKWVYFVVDNYKWVKRFNKYSFKDFKKFIESPLVYGTSYLFLKK